MTLQSFSTTLHDLLFSMTFQAWKIVLPNLVTFHDWGHSVGKRYAVPTKQHLRLPNPSAGGRSGVADMLESTLSANRSSSSCLSSSSSTVSVEMTGCDIIWFIVELSSNTLKQQCTDRLRQFKFKLPRDTFLKSYTAVVSQISLQCYAVWQVSIFTDSILICPGRAS